MLGRAVNVSRSRTPTAWVVEPEFATQSFELSADTLRPCGEDPMGIFLMTFSVVVSMTMTLFNSVTVCHRSADEWDRPPAATL